MYHKIRTNAFLKSANGKQFLDKIIKKKHSDRNSEIVDQVKTITRWIFILTEKICKKVSESIIFWVYVRIQ